MGMVGEGLSGAVGFPVRRRRRQVRGIGERGRSDVDDSTADLFELKDGDRNR